MPDTPPDDARKHEPCTDPRCKDGLDKTFGNAGFMVYRCPKCGKEEWL